MWSRITRELYKKPELLGEYSKPWVSTAPQNRRIPPRSDATIGALRAIRRVGLYRFGRAVVRLGRAMLVAVAKLFTPVNPQSEHYSGKKNDYSWGDAWDDLRIAKKWQRVSEENSKFGDTHEF